MVIIIIILLTLLFTPLLQTIITTSEVKTTSIKSLIYVKRGGVKGVYDILKVNKPNEALYVCIFSPRYGNRSFSLSTNKSEIESLFEKIIKEYRILDYNGKIYGARQIYDYFTYEIFLELEDGKNIKVKWVDEWASEEPIPENLTCIKEILEDFIRQKMIPWE
jgi:hypothetical protein